MKGQDLSCRRFCLATALSALLLMSGVATFNAIIDPFGMYRMIDLTGINHHKPEAYNRVRLLKAFEVRRIKPRAIVLGTSRSHIALNPEHRGWQAGPVYNLAFDGATTKEMYFYLLHADAVRPLKEVVVGLDTYHLTHAPATARPDFDTGLLYNPLAHLELPRLLTADLRILASLDTVRASIVTLRNQTGQREWLAPDGQRLGNVFFRQPDSEFEETGPRNYFEQVDRMEVGFKLAGAPPKTGTAALPEKTMPAGDTQSSIGYVRRIIAYCRMRHIDLRLFITPAHAHQMEISVRMEGWHMVEDGKRDLVNILARDAAAHPGELPIPLFDFSGYSAVTTEPLPPIGSRAEMRNYWDSSHFKQAVGDRILDRVLGWPNSQAGADDFGVRLTPQTIEAALARTRTRQLAYEQTHPADIAEIDAIVHAGEKATAVASQ